MGGVPPFLQPKVNSGGQASQALVQPRMGVRHEGHGEGPPL